MKYGWVYIVVVFLLIEGPIALVYWYRHRRDHSQDQNIATVARRYQLEPALVKALVWRESSFNALAQGRAGEVGLMQIRAPAASEWVRAEKVRSFDMSHLFDPRTNLTAGCWYLSKLLKRYQKTDNPIVYALADYNAGRTHVLRWKQGMASSNSAAFLQKMDFPGTQEYIETILAQRRKYQSAL